MKCLRKVKVCAVWVIVFMLMFSLVNVLASSPTAYAITSENVKNVRDGRLYEKYNPYSANKSTSEKTVTHVSMKTCTDLPIVEREESAEEHGNFLYICGTDSKLYPVWQENTVLPADIDTSDINTDSLLEDDDNQVLSVTYYFNLPVPVDVYFTANESLKAAEFDNYTLWSQDKLVDALISQLGDTPLDELVDMSNYVLLGYAFENDAESPLFTGGETTNLREVFLLNNTDSLELHAIWMAVSTDYIYGDVTKDTSINLSDVVLIQKYLADLNDLDDEQKILADVTGEGEITLLDVTTIQRYVAELINTFPVNDFSQNQG